MKEELKEKMENEEVSEENGCFWKEEVKRQHPGVKHQTCHLCDTHTYTPSSGPLQTEILLCRSLAWDWSQGKPRHLPEVKCANTKKWVLREITV